LKGIGDLDRKMNATGNTKNFNGKGQAKHVLGGRSAGHNPPSRIPKPPGKLKRGNGAKQRSLARALKRRKNLKKGKRGFSVVWRPSATEGTGNGIDEKITTKYKGGKKRPRRKKTASQRERNAPPGSHTTKTFFALRDARLRP